MGGVGLRAAGDDRIVLHFGEALLVSREGTAARITIDLCAEAGDLILIHPGDRQHERVLFDGAAGRLLTESGFVHFLGHDWNGLEPDRGNALRGLIGAVPAAGGWLGHLSVVDNILLASLHHTRTRRRDLLDQAAAIARHLGLPGLPLGLPDEVAPDDLLRAGYVRGFLGSPRLVLLESAATRLPDEFVASLVNAVLGARDRGCTILWSTLDRGLFYDATLPAGQRLQLRGERLQPLEPVE